MSTQNNPLFEAILARLSFGAVPVDGILWLDPRYLERRKATAQTECNSTAGASPTAAPTGPASREAAAKSSPGAGSPSIAVGHPEGAR